MKSFLVYCEGTSPLLMNRFIPEDERGDGEPRAPTVEELLHQDERGRIGLPVENLYASLVNAGKNVKHGGKPVSNGTSYLYDFLVIEGLFIPLVLREGLDIFLPVREWEVFPLPTPNGEKMIPMFSDWGFRVQFNLLENGVNVEILRQVVETAGTRVGLGERRVVHQGAYGRFRIVDWEEVEEIEGPAGMEYIPPPT